MVPSTLKSGRAPFGQLAGQLHIDGDGAILHRRIDAADLSGNNAVVSVDGGGLADLHITRLGFGNLQLRHQVIGLNDFGQLGSGQNVLPDLQRQLNQNSIHTRLNFQPLQLLLLQIGQRASSLLPWPAAPPARRQSPVD